MTQPTADNDRNADAQTANNPMDTCPDGRTRHEWYQKESGEQYCRQCGTTITKSGKWLPPNAGWQPLAPEPNDKPVSEPNIGAPRQHAVAPDAAERAAIRAMLDERTSRTRFSFNSLLEWTLWAEPKDSKIVSTTDRLLAAVERLEAENAALRAQLEHCVTFEYGQGDAFNRPSEGE